MRTGEMVSVHEYLSTSYSPDCDYVDGVLLERNVGEKDHSKLQVRLTLFFGQRGAEWGVSVFTEQRVQVKKDRFRIPDVCVVRDPEPDEQIFTSPPFICIEILSKDDRMSEIQEKVSDYLSFGVPHVWILDPKTRKAWRCTGQGMLESTELRTLEPAIVLPVDSLFA
ncbi:MAG TPA: Uma2 family endonuclease [Candidatus Limnocylindrales bacterium]|nr:Uma2 family endonuclease [Candidatus Limnocylindrales bacterium]